jgi:hypothetical protein
MRNWLVIVMLFLLPLRGLVGDAMAYSMLPSPATTGTAQEKASHWTVVPALFSSASSFLQHISPTSTVVDNATSPPCHSAAMQADEQNGTTSQCTTCQVCHLSAAASVQTLAPLLHTSHVAPLQHTLPWHSAEPRLLLKTPIF